MSVLSTSSLQSSLGAVLSPWLWARAQSCQRELAGTAQATSAASHFNSLTGKQSYLWVHLQIFVIITHFGVMPSWLQSQHRQWVML